MRSLLMALLLLLAVISIYNETVGGSEGTKERVRDYGGSINTSIESINP